MAQASWPSPEHNNRAVTDAEYEQLGVDWSSDGVYGNPTHDAVVTAGPGLNVTIRADVHASVRGRVWTSGGTDLTLPIASNVSGQTRVDRVVLRLDRSTWTIRAVVKQGTPGGGPPTLTTGSVFGTYEVLLANVTVLNGAQAVTVTRGERYAGHRIRPATSTPLTDPSPEMCDTRWETDTERLVMHDGDTLRTIYSHTGPMVVNTAITSWSINADSVLEERNGTVHLRLGSFKRTGGRVPDGGVRLPVSIPEAYQHPNRGQYGIAYISGLRIGRLEIFAKNSGRPGQVWLVQYPAIERDDDVMPGSGISWVVG